MSCRAFVENDVLTLETGALSRKFFWNNGAITGLDIKSAHDDSVWALSNTGPDCRLEWSPDIPDGAGELVVGDFVATSTHPAHLRAVVTCRIGALWIQRVFRLYENCPAIACDYYFRGVMPSLGADDNADVSQRVNLESSRVAKTHQSEALTLDRICIDRKHLALEAVRFYDVTDYRNTLVERHEVLPYRFDSALSGNLLLVKDHCRRRGMFWLKEAPCSDVQIGTGREDFIHRIGDVRVVGAGVNPDDVTPDKWVRGYSVVTGLASGSDEDAILESLRRYQHAARPYRPDRDSMIMLNTWGDRNTYKSINASFVKDEISAAVRLGLTHFQIDDGWQKGPSPAALKTIEERHDALRAPDYWDVNPDKFPEGLGKTTAYAREKGVELCLWFNPNPKESFRYWRDDVNVLTRLYSEYGIRTFKIDGVDIPDKTAETNFRGLLDNVLEQTGGQACFNLDITAGRRFGYHYFYEYGNFFLENRYTDWSNYHPHWTLRNLWMLSRYVPAQRMQIEFLNIWRNPDKYSQSDPLSPLKAGFEFAFAVAMPAQPLAWFEASCLPDEAFELAGLIAIYREHRQSLHSGHIWPVGECPNGFNFSGFQSVAPDGNSGYIIVYRQAGSDDTARIRLKQLPPDAGLRLEALAGAAVSGGVSLDDESRLMVKLEKRFSFSFYRYELM